MSEYPQSETAMLLRIQQLEDALRQLQSGIKMHIEALGSIAPVHPTIFAWRDFVDAALSRDPSEAPEKEGEDG